MDYGILQTHNDLESKHHIGSNMSLYKFQNEGTIPIFFKNYKIPEYVQNEKQHKVKYNEINRLDNISYMYYGTPELFWIIMLVNNIINPFEIEEGAVLRIIPKNYIEDNILRYEDSDF